MAAKKKKAAAKKKTAPKKSATKKAPAKKAATKKAATKKAPAKTKATTAAELPVDMSAAPAEAAEVVEKKPAGPVDPTVEIAHAVAALALDKKAEDVLILKVTELTSYADCFILASAPSERQVQAIARHVGEEMKKAGKAPVGTEGLEQGHWVLVDLGAVVLHVFLSSARQYYDLEGFWSDAPRIEANEKHGLEVLAAMKAAHDEASGDGGDGGDGDDDDGHLAVANE